MPAATDCEVGEALSVKLAVVEAGGAPTVRVIEVLLVMLPLVPARVKV